MMAVDKSKQTGVWYLNVDVELHCYCGQYIQNCNEVNLITCPNCGQRWLITVSAVDLGEEYDVK
jgi:predicted RNA-binding Zn-ribbon protein involved in translation (DUF1610 family)